MIWKWATIIGLSMTPALIAGQSAAAAAGIGFGFDPWIFVPVIAVAGAIEGLLLAWLSGESERIGFIHRFCVWMRKPKAVEFARKWGRWGGMFLGVAIVGQEPIIVSLRWLGVDLRKMALPIVASNAVFAVIYYLIVRAGWDAVSAM